VNSVVGVATDFLESFRLRHGRAPRILHVGNVANNAYINAKILNRAGFDCDVACYEYYHIMGTPEWQDADFESNGIDQFFPNWQSMDLGDYQRPRWFAQGPTDLCIKYLISKRRGADDLAETYWQKLALVNQTARELTDLRDGAGDRLDSMTANSPRQGGIKNSLAGARRFMAFYFAACAHPEAYTHLWGLLGRIGKHRPFPMWLLLAVLAPLLVVFIGTMRLVHRLQWQLAAFAGLGRRAGMGNYSFRRRTRVLTRLFRKIFPDRMDLLTTRDCQIYEFVAANWRELFCEYDLVQCYAMDPILPLLADVRPFIAFEHGTLRSHTLGDDPVCRLNALGYNQADHTFITNGDCLEFAQKIGVTRYSPMVHPIDVEAFRDADLQPSMLKEELGVDYLFFCPVRHDWAIKGTDKYIRALPAIEKSLAGTFALVMTEWGEQVQDSKALAEELGVSHLLHWITPIPKLRLAKILKITDAVFDQLALPHFGATAPEAMAAGVPVLMSYRPESTAWIIEEPAPILACHSVEDIAANALKAIDPEYLATYKQQARDWFDRYHSPDVVLAKHVAVYADLLEKSM